MNKPFDPWTATEEEAKTAEQRFQMNVAQYVIDYREEYVLESWSELRLLETISWILKAGLKAPRRLSEEFDRRLQPILTGQVADFKEWQTGITDKQRQKRASHLDAWVVYFIDKLRADAPGKYTTGLEDKNNVYEAARPLIMEKVGKLVKVPNASGLRKIYYDDVKTILKGGKPKQRKKKSNKPKA